MNTQNKIRSIATKTMAMLISAIYLAVSVNVPVLAQDVTGPITDGNNEGDVEVTAAYIFRDNINSLNVDCIFYSNNFFY